MSSATTGGGLKKILGLGFGIAIIIGGTIGVGILRTPGVIAGLLHSKALIIAAWVFGGLYVTLAASSLAELAAMLPKAGGAFNYVKAAFGPYAGFLTGWFDYIVNSIAPAYFAIAISEYLSAIIPSLKGSETIIAIILIMLLTGLHITGLKSGSLTQQIITALKVLLLVGIVAACFVHGPAEATSYPAVNQTLAAGGVMIAFLKSLQLIMGTYDGWGSSIFFAEEDKEPGKNVAKALFSGIAIIISVYLLVNLALLYVLPLETLSKSPLPAAEAGSLIFGKWGYLIISIVALVSLLGILNALVMITPRILFGLSRDGFFAGKAKAVNKGGTPAVALLISNAIAVTLIVIGSFEQLFALGAFMTMAINALIFSSVFRLRKIAPEYPRPYRAWGYPYTTLIVLIVSMSLFVGFAISDFRNFLFVAGITLLSYPAFRIITKNKKQ